MRTAVAFVLAFASASGVAAQELSSQRDYTDNAQRDLPIACMPGDIEGHPGKTLGDVFGSDWPAQPEASSPEARSKPWLVELGPLRWPRGMDYQDAVVIMAVLVAADGTPLRAEPLCSTRMGLTTSVRRALMNGTFVPAMIDGKPVTSVVAIAQVFNASDQPEPVKRRRR
ncbi:MAG: hypothetical protein M3Y70_09445 [Pseudomonadota bacterium]|nr:hypothetical protein [Pseudomonadota bacterium]